MKKKETHRSRDKKLLLQLFAATFYLSAFTFGGGYVIITLMQKKFVEEYHWIDEEEMFDLTAIAQSAPGPIAVNGAIVAGYKLAGIPGVLVSVTGAVLPPFFIIALVSAFYEAFRHNRIISLMLEGMQAGVGAVIAAVVIEMIQNLFHKSRQIDSAVIMAGAFIANVFLGIGAVYIFLFCIVYGIGKALWEKGRGRI